MASDKEIEAIASDSNFEIITTFAYSAGLSHNKALLSESRCYLLQHSIDRLQAAAADFSWTAVVEYLASVGCAQSLSEQISAHMLSTHGNECEDPSRRFIPYTAAWKRAGLDETTPPAECDVLLQNEDGYIMGSAFRTVYFWRDGGFVTPSSVTGCKVGVSRRWAIENTGVQETLIAANHVRDGEVVWLSSAVGGFIQAEVTLKSKIQDG
ncbi:aminodeoxychorismate lyase [Colletotrichum falcatum]|nr:aminodeoxychorismate lyase [Colletotrichum falcatum]